MKSIISSVLGLTWLATIGVMMFQSSANAIEMPDYAVLKEDDKFELREYPPMLLAEVQVSGDRQTASNRGFRKLAGFIFGDNVSADAGSEKIAMTSPVMQTPQSEKIAMTSPVVQTPNGSDAMSSDAQSWIVNFMMPSEYSMKTLPTPTDNDIRIYETETYQTASVRFSGGGSAKDLAKYEAKLRGWIEANNLIIEGGPEYAFYDAPWVPKFMRRNEVHFRVRTAG